MNGQAALKHGVSVFFDPTPDSVTRIFAGLVSDGCRGLYLTARLPVDVLPRPDKGSAEYIWMARSGAESGTGSDSIVCDKIERFLDKYEGGVVAVDCVGCAGLAGSGKTLPGLLGAVSRKAKNKRAYVLVQIPAGTLDEDGRKALVNAMKREHLDVHDRQ